MSERLELLEEYSRAISIYEKAKAHLEAIKIQLKEFGTFSEGGWSVDVSVVKRETISLKEIQKAKPSIYKELVDMGLVNTSESERLTVKLKEIT